MPQIDSVPVTDARATALLEHYFAHRAETFPADQGSYVTTPPSPAQFVPPQGVFLIAVDETGAAIACGGVRRIQRDEKTMLVRFEVKHLWVEPVARGSGLGRAMLAELESRAKQLEAEELVLDTNASLAEAGGLYLSSGYAPIKPYNTNPNANTWLGKTL